MTRGKILFTEDSITLYSSIEFNGDMHPDGSFAKGGRVVKAFKKHELDTEKNYREYVREFDDENFGYAHNYEIDLIQDAFRLENLEFDVRKNYTDYLYIINRSEKELQLITEDGKRPLEPDSLGIVYFQKYKKTISGTEKENTEKVLPFIIHPSDKYKQIIIVRKDLELSPGKLAAQCSHASMAFLTTQICEKARHGTECYEATLTFGEKLYENWMEGEFTKCILCARNRNQLLKAKSLAEQMGMKKDRDFFLIRDNCHTELEPEEFDKSGVGCTLTCIGFRPMDERIIDSIGKKYQLY